VLDGGKTVVRHHAHRRPSGAAFSAAVRNEPTTAFQLSRVSFDFGLNAPDRCSSVSSPVK